MELAQSAFSINNEFLLNVGKDMHELIPWSYCTW